MEAWLVQGEEDRETEADNVPRLYLLWRLDMDPGDMVKWVNDNNDEFRVSYDPEDRSVSLNARSFIACDEDTPFSTGMILGNVRGYLSTCLSSVRRMEYELLMAHLDANPPVGDDLEADGRILISVSLNGDVSVLATDNEWARFDTEGIEYDPDAILSDEDAPLPSGIYVWSGKITLTRDLHPHPDDSLFYPVYKGTCRQVTPTELLDLMAMKPKGGIHAPDVR